MLIFNNKYLLGMVNAADAFSQLLEAFYSLNIMSLVGQCMNVSTRDNLNTFRNSNTPQPYDELMKQTKQNFSQLINEQYGNLEILDKLKSGCSEESKNYQLQANDSNFMSSVTNFFSKTKETKKEQTTESLYYCQ